MINACAILHEKRFLAKCNVLPKTCGLTSAWVEAHVLALFADGWASIDPMSGEDASVKARIITMLNAVRTILRCERAVPLTHCAADVLLVCRAASILQRIDDSVSFCPRMMRSGVHSSACKQSATPRCVSQRGSMYMQHCEQAAEYSCSRTVHLSH